MKKRYYIDEANRAVRKYEPRNEAPAINSFATFEQAKTALLQCLKEEHRIYVEAIEAFAEEAKQAKKELATLEAKIHQINVSDEADWR
jgi:folate-dependent phosphoribosylglycinamide formyltransferase PurN